MLAKGKLCIWLGHIGTNCVLFAQLFCKPKIAPKSKVYEKKTENNNNVKGRNLIILIGLSKVNLRIFTSKTFRQNSQNRKKKKIIM